MGVNEHMSVNEMSGASPGSADDSAGDSSADPLVDLVLEEPGWADALPSLAEIATKAAWLALEEVGLPDEGFSIALLACDDARIAELNGEFRGRPQPTNVLSWPAFDLVPASPGAYPPKPPSGGVAGPRQPLGDIAIALETVTREAEQQNLPLKNHATHLILHACLHLLGYDHETAPDAALMEELERHSLARAGIPDPYEPDSHEKEAWAKDPRGDGTSKR